MLAYQVLFVLFVFHTQNASTRLTQLRSIHNPRVAYQENNMEDYRLPNTIKPVQYDLTLKPNLSNGLFDGFIKITANLSAPTEQIKLHSNGLTVNDVKIDGTKRNFSIDKKHELLVVAVGDGMLPASDVLLEISFSGDMKNRIVGLYTSKYQNAKGDEVYMATSKFEPTYARQAYPCFDEPNMKAKYTVRLLKPKDPSYIALSNMPQDYETEQDDGILVTFKESVPMSTYLSCFIVSDFLATEDVIHSKNGEIPIRVFATPAQLKKTQYALEATKKVMDYYLKYFKNPYPLPKLDMAAIPDFVSGAMEHWGLVTYRETALLYSPEISSTKNKERVVQVIAHELAHSWFGNLVTMDWWNDLWLNEGFASYIEYKGTDAAEPTWKKLEQFTINDLHPVLKLDSTLASHPIVQTVLTPDQITEIFDTISYNKGAAVLRMLENSVGDDIFQEGVNNYLDKHKFGNAITQDLLNEIQLLVPKDINITDYINTWTIQMGYPVISVQKMNDGYRLTQKRFLTDPRNEGKDNTPTPYKYRWTIPVTYITDTNKNKTQVWFKHDQEHLDIVTDAKWIKFNPLQAGYYRVNYELPEWRKLFENIDEFNVPDKAHLIEETFRLAESTAISYEVPLDITKYLKRELEYVPWSTANTLLSEIKVYMMNSELYTDFKEYLINIVTPAYNNYTWNETIDESFLTKLARITVISLACSAGHPECMQEAHDRFKGWLDNQEKLSLDLKELVYKYGAQSATVTDWEKMWGIFVAESDAGEKLRLLRGLAYVNNISLLKKLINLAKDDTYIRGQDYFTCLSYISYNPVGTSLVWDYVREHWEELVDRFTLNDRGLGKLIPTITETFSSQVKKDEMLAFFAKYPDAGAGVAARARALETVDNNINWLANNKKSVEDWLRANKDF